MANEIEDYVADNTRRTRQIDTRFVEVAAERTRNLSFTNNTFSLTASIEIYTRPLNDSLISGHPNAKHGSGRGVAGDTRGSWSLETSSATTGVFTASGRTAVRDALGGEPTGGVDAGVIGTGSDDATVSDDTLTAETGSTTAYGYADADDKLRVRSDYRFSDHPIGDAEEYGIESAGGKLYARFTETVALTEEQEVRTDITLTISGSGIGGQVIPTSGLTAVRDSIDNAGSIGINSIAFGTGTIEFTESDTNLNAEVYEKEVITNLTSENVEAEVYTSESEPASQPVDLSEIAVFDNQGNAMMLATFTEFEKTDQFPFNARAGFRVV